MLRRGQIVASMFHIGKFDHGTACDVLFEYICLYYNKSPDKVEYNKTRARENVSITTKVIALRKRDQYSTNQHDCIRQSVPYHRRH